MSKCWYCNNELTSGDSPKHFGICNKCYDEIFKISDTIISSFTNKISDLEAKLAESEEKVKHWHDLYNERDKQFQSTRQRYHLLNKLQSNYDKKDKLHLAYMQCLELVEENEKLKQQLAEKDKEIERLNLEFETQEDWQEKWQKLYDETCNLTQDKISFAVEQLEFAQKYIQQYVNNFDDMNDCLYSIDNQIKELKGYK